MTELHHSHLSKKSTYKFNNYRAQSSSLSKEIFHKGKEESSKTPPLPANSASIEELLKKRKSIQKELKDIAECANNDLKYKETSKKKENNKHKIHKIQSRKRHSDKYEKNNDNIKKKKTAVDSPLQNNEDHSPIQSEDEDSIIEERRRQRKILLEKLTISNRNNEYDDSTINKDVKINKEIPKSPDICLPISVKGTTDMFAEHNDYFSNNVPEQITQDNESHTLLSDNWDDSEGYYNIKVGDKINKNRYTIRNILGKGMFANVVQAQDNIKDNAYVAIKIVRNNDLMYNNSLKEINLLKEINDSDPEDKYHCVRLLEHFIHKSHLCLVLECLHMDLRCVIKKYGRNDGINIKAIMSYSRQMLLALRLLKKIGIVHADIKPDNILVNEKKNILKLCDFGSARKLDDNEITPYLVSRFYRAPEIILGMSYKHGVDMWSVGCTIYEISTGKIMFTGNSNNKMLKCFMDIKGKIPNRLIRKGKFKDQHFNYNNHFLLHKIDEITGREKLVEICNIKITRNLDKELKGQRNLCSSEEKKLAQLKDLLDKMTMLDPNQRPSVTDCLLHAFIQEDIQN